MIKKSIVFAAFDEEYVATIEFKLAKLTEERASIEFITDAGCLEAFLERPKKIDVLILPYGIMLPHPEAFSKTSIYYLTEEEMADFTRKYTQAVNGRFDVSGIEERLNIFIPITCLRGITYVS